MRLRVMWYISVPLTMGLFAASVAGAVRVWRVQGWSLDSFVAMAITAAALLVAVELLVTGVVTIADDRATRTSWLGIRRTIVRIENSSLVLTSRTNAFNVNVPIVVISDGQSRISLATSVYWPREIKQAVRMLLECGSDAAPEVRTRYGFPSVDR
jgi:hypothetical protein